MTELCWEAAGVHPNRPACAAFDNDDSFKVDTRASRTRHKRLLSLLKGVDKLFQNDWCRRRNEFAPRRPPLLISHFLAANASSAVRSRRCCSNIHIFRICTCPQPGCRDKGAGGGARCINELRVA